MLAQEATTVKCDKLFIYNNKYQVSQSCALMIGVTLCAIQRWHECSAILRPPNLIVTEHHDMSIDVSIIITAPYFN